MFGLFQKVTYTCTACGARQRIPRRRIHFFERMFWGEYEFQEGLFETFEFTARDVWGAEFRATPQLGQVELTAGAGYIHYRTAGDQSFPETPSRRQGYWGFLEANYRSMFFRVEGRAYEGRSQPTLPTEDEGPGGSDRRSRASLFTE